MTIGRVLAAAVIFAGVALASAGPASAENVLSGLYSYQQAGQPAVTWTIYPTCVPAGCMLHVSSGPATGGTNGYGGDAHRVNDLWMFGWYDAAGLSCPDGSTGPVQYSYTFDDKTLTGTKTTMRPQTCGHEPAMTKEPFTLGFLRELDIPVEQYPYMCPTWPHCDYNTVIPGANYPGS
jgi:hypothetical protein